MNRKNPLFLNIVFLLAGILFSPYITHFSGFDQFNGQNIDDIEIFYSSFVEEDLLESPSSETSITDHYTITLQDSDGDMKIQRESK